MKLKVCGMKHPENICQVATLQPDYMGFIFYDKSPRNFTGEIPELPKNIKKTGVFVNESIDFVSEMIQKHDFKAVQLHGEESAEYCKELKAKLSFRTRNEEGFHEVSQSENYRDSSNKCDCHFERSEKSKNEISQSLLSFRNDKQVEIIKVFSIKNEFNFSILKPYEAIVDYYLFDTKGKAKGGNGYTFDWQVLANYPSIKPYFLSGGIGLDEIENVMSFLHRQESKYCYALDVNSKFEIEPSLKNIERLNKFKDLLSFRT